MSCKLNLFILEVTLRYLVQGEHSRAASESLLPLLLPPRRSVPSILGLMLLTLTEVDSTICLAAMIGQTEVSPI